MTTTLAHICRRCGRPLTDETSVARGIGPECVALEAGETAFATTWPRGLAVVERRTGQAGKVLASDVGTDRVRVNMGWFVMWMRVDEVEAVEEGMAAA